VDEIAQERRSDGLGLGGANVLAENQTPAVAVAAPTATITAAILTLSLVASIRRYGQLPSVIGRARNAFSLSSISSHSWTFSAMRRLQEARKVDPLRAWIAQLDHAGAGFPDTVAIAVVLGPSAGFFSP
jgi:hypothetical protein